MATARVLRPSDAAQRSGNSEHTRHLRVVRPDNGRRTRFRLTTKTGVVLTVLLFIALFGVAVSHTLLIESQIELDALDQQVAGEQARYEDLRRDVAQLESPDRIIEEARDRFGMVPPDDVVWVTPDEPAPTKAATGAEPDTPGTSWAEVKPYLESAP